MKVLLWTLALLVASHAKAGDIRVCPEGHFYAGDDTRPSTMDRSYWLEEISRSPVYSCYSLQSDVGGIGAAIAECQQRKSSVVVFEDRSEVHRVVSALISQKDTAGNVSFATSGMHFADIDGWIWLGTKNYSAVPVPMPVIANNVTVEQCLRVVAERNETSGKWTLKFASLRCNDPSDYLCEIRVQTVTYYAWFYSNWFTLLLVVVVVVLMSALCMSLFLSKPKMYRGRFRSRRSAQQNVLSSFTIGDGPPPYKEVAGNQTAGSKLDQYRNKGKDIIAKVTYYKQKPSQAST